MDHNSRDIEKNIDVSPRFVSFLSWMLDKTSATEVIRIVEKPYNYSIEWSEFLADRDWN